MANKSLKSREYRELNEFFFGFVDPMRVTLKVLCIYCSEADLRLS